MKKLVNTNALCYCQFDCLILYQIEENGFSSEEQKRIEFSKQELFDMYNPVRKLPDEFMKSPHLE